MIMMMEGHQPDDFEKKEEIKSQIILPYEEFLRRSESDIGLCIAQLIATNKFTHTFSPRSE